MTDVVSTGQISSSSRPEFPRDSHNGTRLQGHKHSRSQTIQEVTQFFDVKVFARRDDVDEAGRLCAGHWCWRGW